MSHQNGYLGDVADSNSCDKKQKKNSKSGKPWCDGNSDFLGQHKNQLKMSNLRYKRLKDDVQRTEKTILQYDAYIKELQEKMQGNFKKYPQPIIKNKNLEYECAHYQQLYHQESLKYCTLESSYDKKLLDLRNEFERISKQQCDHEELLVEQVKQLTKEFQTLHDENKLKQLKLDQIENELNIVRSTNEIQLKTVKEENAALINEFELKISNMETELKQKDDIIYKCNLEINELEIAKNKIINEQAYKLHQVNRVIDQPTISVSPASTKFVNFNNVDEKVNTRPQMDNTNANPQTSDDTKVHTSQTINSKEINKTENKTSHTNVLLRKPQRKVNYFEYDSSSSDEEEFLEGWHPVLSKDNSTKAQPSFQVKKRRIEETEIPSSSELDKTFNRLLSKRFKK